MDWNSVDWAVLERLRARFLERDNAGGPYWHDARDLANYDFTFGRRIAWKWAAVLEPLFRRGWQQPARRLIDWGCGSGIAARSVLAYAPPGSWDAVVLWDHSPTATDFAAHCIKEKYPELEVSVREPSSPPDGEGAFVLVVSHVLNELEDDARTNLLALARQAAAVIWVEPGTFEDSRALIAAREALRSEFHCWSPCTHDAGCGLLTPDNERHWCHHFARPPTEVFTDAGWGKFSRRLEIDLRSLPYSHLVLDRRKPDGIGIRATNADGPLSAEPEDTEVVPPPSSRSERRGIEPTTKGRSGYNRIIGEPRESSGLMRILRCREDGVRELELQKRDDPKLWKALKKGAHDGVFIWREEDGRILPD